MRREEQPVTPGCFTKMVVRRPCGVAILCLVLSLLVSMAAVRGGGMPELVQRSGWNNDHSPVMLSTRAIGTMRSNAVSSSDVDAPAASEVAGDVSSGADTSASTGVDPALSDQLTSTMLLFDAHDGHSVLTADGIATIAAFEARVLELPGHTAHCQRVYSADDPAEYACASPQSILPVVYLNASAHAEQCARGFCIAPAAALPLCGGLTPWGVPPCVSRIFDWRHATLAPESDWPGLLRTRLCGPMPFMRRLLLSADATCTSDDMDATTVRFARSFLPLGWPLLNWTSDAGGGNATDIDGQWQELRSGAYIKALKTELRAAQDDLSATTAWAKVYSTSPAPSRPLSVLWSNSASGSINDFILPDMMLATASFAFVFFYVTFNLRSVFLACCGMFEIVISLPLAFFVWKTLLQQSRISWLQVLSVYILLCVGADDLFVFHDTWKQSAEMHPGISGELSSRFAWTFRRAALAMLTTTATTAICLGATAASPMGQMQAFGIFTALAIIADYIMVITFFPACVVIHAKYLTPCTSRMLGCCCGPPPTPASRIERGGKHADDVEGGGGKRKERRMTRFLRDSIAPFLHRRRWALIAVFASIAAGAITYVYTNMTPAEELKFFNPDHPMQMMIDINANEFLGREEWKHQTTFAYGLSTPPLVYEASVEFLRADIQTDGDPWSVAYQGSATFDAPMQLRVAADCDTAAADASLVADREVYCILNELRDWAPDAFPYATAAALHEAMRAFYASTKYATLRANFSGYASRTGFVSSTDGASGGNVLGLFQTFNTTIPTNIRPTPGQTGPWFDVWDRFAEAQCGDIGCIQTGPWAWYDILSSLFSFAMSTTVICIICSFVVLLFATGNALIALFATVTIVAVIACVLCGILFLGFAFGMFEWCAASPSPPSLPSSSSAAATTHAHSRLHARPHTLLTRPVPLLASAASSSSSLAGWPSTTPSTSRTFTSTPTARARSARRPRCTAWASPSLAARSRRWAPARRSTSARSSSSDSTAPSSFSRRGSRSPSRLACSSRC